MYSMNRPLAWIMTAWNRLVGDPETLQRQSYFVVTHDYEFVCQTCTRLIRFDHHTMTNDILLSQENEATILSFMGLGGMKMKTKKENPVLLLLKWAEKDRGFLIASVICAFLGGLLAIGPYIGIYRLMDAF